MKRLRAGVRFRDGSDLRQMEPVLKNWVNAVEEYTAAFESDACWWYTERASVGVLAGAAWRTKGWLALEEFSTLKRDGRGEHKNGRCDLYLLNKGEGGMSFAFEAKQAQQNMGARTFESLGRVEKKLTGAWGDTGKLRRSEAQKRVAMCFVVPKMPVSEADGIDGALKSWLDGVENEVPWDALAWVFPEQARRLERGCGRVFPGVVLLMQERRRAARALSA